VKRVNKQTIVLDKVLPKKHSVRYDTSDKEAAISTIYLMRSALGSSIPKVIKVTVEEG
jgi:hypothetical protein